MRIVVPSVICAIALIVPIAASQAPKPGAPLPPGHPPLNPLPPGHPPTTAPAVRVPPSHPSTTPRAEADRADVATPGAIVQSYYDAVSGPVGAPRDWDRFRSLFIPGARLITVNPGTNADVPLVLEPEQFVGLNRRYFEGSGYVERAIRGRHDAFARIAHVWSTYEARRGGEAGEPYARGITSFQLVLANGRWWIAGLTWDRERGDATIPSKYLPAAP